MMGSWEGSQIRNDVLAMNTSMTESENGLSEVNTTPVKTPPKVNWGCDNTSPDTGKYRGWLYGRLITLTLNLLDELSN